MKKILLFILCFVFFIGFLHAKEYDHVREEIIDYSDNYRIFELANDLSFSARTENNILYIELNNDSQMKIDFAIQVQILDPHYDILYTYSDYDFNGTKESRHYGSEGYEGATFYKIIFSYNDFERYRDLYPNEDYVIVNMNIYNGKMKDHNTEINEEFKIMKTNEDAKYFHRKIPKKISYAGKERSYKISLIDNSNNFYELKETNDYYEFIYSIEDMEVDTVKTINLQYIINCANYDFNEYFVSELYDSENIILNFEQTYYDYQSNEGNKMFILNGVSCEVNGINDPVYDYHNKAKNIPKGTSIVCYLSYANGFTDFNESVTDSKPTIFDFLPYDNRLIRVVVLVVIFIVVISTVVKNLKDNYLNY